MHQDPFNCLTQLNLPNAEAQYYSLPSLKVEGSTPLEKLPFSIRVLLEQALRNVDDFQVNQEDVRALACWKAGTKSEQEIPFKPTRVILQDFTGVPAVVDLAAMRSAMIELGGNPDLINPRVPVDLIIDHSVQVDVSASPDAVQKNMEIEFERNRERYQFLKWGQQSFEQFRVFPPGVGIVHQVNLEHVAQVVQMRDGLCFPDTLVGTDSHTTMVNGLGVMGWGVGGIEAESVMLGQPVSMLIPEVVGFRLLGQLREGVTATDLVLRIVEMLRQKGVVEKFVEFFGTGLSALPLADRATVANMAPEYGATMGFFPIDSETLNYLRNTGRPEELVQRVEIYSKEQGLFRTESTPDPEYSDLLELNLESVEPALAGPKRPQDRVPLNSMQSTWKKTLQAPMKERGFELESSQLESSVNLKDTGASLKHGSVVIAAITSCTNTSNPSVMMAAGLLAKKAVERGLRPKNWVKTSLGPGSRVVTDYLDAAGLSQPLEELGFHTVGYGCTTCIGNSGPLDDEIVNAIQEGSLVTTSVLSGNRNFEGRISPHVKANYLASPPLVVAYSLAGTVDIDLNSEPLGSDPNGNEVFLKDIWPSSEEIASVQNQIRREMYQQEYGRADQHSPLWNTIDAPSGSVYEWDDDSTYIQNPPFFQGMSMELNEIKDINSARVLVKVGDSVTTDHISPAGAFAQDTPAGKYLRERGVEQKDFNSYGSRRGNDRIMTRGTFANVRLRNQIAPETEGGFTTHFPTDEVTSVFDASMRYQAEGTPLVVLAGTQYGTGSSRDWAAKGTLLLGVKAVIATSFERIHRSNLVGMGVLPLTFPEGENADSLGLDGTETFDIPASADLVPLSAIRVKATKENGDVIEFDAIVRLDTPVEVDYYRNGGILQTVLRNLSET